MNWGTGIALTFTVFCGIMVFLVISSFQQDFYLVTENYYEEELTYQQRIDALQSTLSLKDQVQMTQLADHYNFQLPHHGVKKSKLHLYKPDNENLDLKMTINGDKINIPYTVLSSGKYIAKISWEANRKKYYQEITFFAD